MKKFKGILLNIPIAIALIFSLNSCGDKDKDEPEKSNYISAKVNGAIWSPSTVQCILLEDTTLQFRIVNISATYGGKTITIEVDDHGSGHSINIGTRTYAAGSAFFKYSASSTPYNTTSGSINITSCETSSQLITGTFNFSAVDNDGNTVSIADGKFEKVTFSTEVQ